MVMDIVVALIMVGVAVLFVYAALDATNMDGNPSVEGFVKCKSRTCKYSVRSANGIRENGERYIDAAWTVQNFIILSIDGPERCGA